MARTRSGFSRRPDREISRSGVYILTENNDSVEPPSGPDLGCEGVRGLEELRNAYPFEFHDLLLWTEARGASWIVYVPTSLCPARRQFLGSSCVSPPY
jgi:hypothetical protein